MNTLARTYLFDEPLLRMGMIPRFIVRLIEYTTYAFLVVLCVAALLSDVAQLAAFGWLLVLFLGDRLLHAGKAENDFSHLPAGLVALENYISPVTLSIFEYGFSRALSLSGNLSLYLLERLLARYDVRLVLQRMSIPPQQFQEQLIQELGQ